MNKVTEHAIVKKFGWHRLGQMECEVEVPLTDAEKLQMGHSQGENLCAIKNMKEEFAEIRKDFKHRIDDLLQIVGPAAEMLRTGTKKVTKTLPAFFDPDTKERKFVDLETGEEVSSIPATESDLQLVM